MRKSYGREVEEQQASKHHHPCIKLEETKVTPEEGLLNLLWYSMSSLLYRLMVTLQLPCREQNFEKGKTKNAQNQSQVAFFPPHQDARLAERVLLVAPHANWKKPRFVFHNIAL